MAKRASRRGRVHVNDPGHPVLFFALMAVLHTVAGFFLLSPAMAVLLIIFYVDEG